MVNRPEQLCINAKFTDLNKYRLWKAIISWTILQTLQILMIYDDLLSQMGKCVYICKW